jgi:hypothetical protein
MHRLRGKKIGFAYSCFFGSFYILDCSAHQELQFDYSCQHVLTNFVSNFGSLEGLKMGSFGYIPLESARGATLELNSGNESCRGGSKDNFGAKFL